MAPLVEHVVGGLASGGVYALLALALVLVHRASGVVNVAQGELATLSAFVCLALVDHGWTFWTAFAATAALSFGGGTVLHALVIRPAEGGPLPGLAVLTAGLLLAVNGLDTWIWGAGERRLDGPFSAAAVQLGGAALPKRELGAIAVSLTCLLLVAALLSRTKAGLGLRAAGAHPAEARLAGVPVASMSAVAWGLAAALGAAAGVLAATLGPLTPGLMLAALLYAATAAVLGGLASPAGAVAAALLLGMALEPLAAEVRPAAALALLVCGLIARRV